MYEVNEHRVIVNPTIIHQKKIGSISVTIKGANIEGTEYYGYSIQISGHGLYCGVGVPISIDRPSELDTVLQVISNTIANYGKGHSNVVLDLFKFDFLPKPNFHLSIF